MAQFPEHIFQVENNLSFLKEVETKIDNYFDWKVTICFYCAVHLANAHLSKFGLQYRQHNEVNFALNPETETSLSKLPENEYVAYITLQQLSRRSRYLVNEKDGNLKNSNAFLTHEKHYERAKKHVYTLTYYLSSLYHLNLTK